jgi:hypothetical protein
MRRAAAVAVAVLLHLGVDHVRSARAGETYMGLAAGTSPRGTGAFAETYDSRGHAAVSFVWGVEAAGVTIDLRVDGGGYTVVGDDAPADAVLMRFGADLGKRVWIEPRVAIGASIGLAAAKMVKWSERDQIDESDLVGGGMWGIAARIEYVLGRIPPPNPQYRGPVDYLGASLVAELRREDMFLGEAERRFEPTATVFFAGLRGTMGW